MSFRAFLFVSVAGLVGCGPQTGERDCPGGITDTDTDRFNCGGCGNTCADGFNCFSGKCIIGECEPGAVEDCYSGVEETLGVGPCIGGTRTCVNGTWSACEGEVVPVGEDGPRCSDGIDNNCNGAIDENEDRDGDGQSTCGGDCCDSTECDKPHLVNAGAFDAAGNNFDDDCNGIVDDTPLLCDQGISSNTTNALDFARAIDICQTATMTDRKWGVIEGSLSLVDGTGTPDPNGHAVRPSFGTGLQPQGGINLAILSTGAAAAKGDTNPAYHDFVSYSHVGTQSCGFYSNAKCSPYPPDFYAANGNSIPNAPGCPAPDDDDLANDPVMLTFKIRVPTNAKSFKLSTNFYSAEFPEWTCSAYNHFIVVLLDSTYMGTPPNPTDKNLAFYQPQGSMNKFPVGVNLGHGNTGLFTQCVNGSTGCSGTAGTISTCVGTNQLAGTGFDDPNPRCDSNSLEGGATGWLVTSGNVTPGEIMTLRIGIWDTSDQAYDSLAVIDGFQWSTELAQPGTVIFNERPTLDSPPAALAGTVLRN